MTVVSGPTAGTERNRRIDTIAELKLPYSGLLTESYFINQIKNGEMNGEVDK